MNKKNALKLALKEFKVMGDMSLDPKEVRQYNDAFVTIDKMLRA